MTDRPTPIPGARPTFPEADIPGILDEIAGVLRGGRLILGPKARELEALWTARLGVKHAVAVSSCTAALEIAYRFYKVCGKEVVIPTNTFVATANAAMAAGAKVVFAEMDANDYGVDVDDAVAKLSDRTGAVVVVHIAGFVPAGVERLRAACRERGIPLIEDCAHAHGASYVATDGKRVEAGAIGDVGCFSFYPTKVLTSGVGGLVSTNDDELAAFARSLRHHGQGASLEEIVHAGNDWMLDEVRAVLAVAQTRRLDEFLATRRRVAARYDELLRDDARFELPKLGATMHPAFYKYPVLLPEGVDARAVRKRAYDEHAIELGSLYYPPCHLMPVFRNALGTGPGQLPVSERLLARQICLPMHAQVSLDDADRSVAVLRELVLTA
jgi:perosamine synthetase